MTATNEQLHFPLTWYGKLITRKEAGDVTPLVQDIFLRLNLALQADVTPGPASSAGTYSTWNLKAVLPDYETMLALFADLENLPGVRMLI